MSLVAADPPCGFPLMRLPAELRLQIYRLLLTGRTIHIDDIEEKPARFCPQGLCELTYNICTASDAMQSLSHLTGAGHSQDHSSATIRSTQQPCLGIHDFRGSPCNDPVRIDVQLLRVCHQIYDEAVMMPYAENYFIIPGGFHTNFREAFVAQFSPEKRSAMHTVAVLKNWETDITWIPALLPGLKRLWFDVNKASYAKNWTLATRQSKVVETFSQIKLPSLIGVAVNYHCAWIVGKDGKSVEDRLELALLGNQSM